jgi:hypothetical protein
MATDKATPPRSAPERAEQLPEPRQHDQHVRDRQWVMAVDHAIKEYIRGS